MACCKRCSTSCSGRLRWRLGWRRLGLAWIAVRPVFVDPVFVDLVAARPGVDRTVAGRRLVLAALVLATAHPVRLRLAARNCPLTPVPVRIPAARLILVLILADRDSPLDFPASIAP